MEGVWLDGQLDGRVTEDNDYGGFEVSEHHRHCHHLHDHHLLVYQHRQTRLRRELFQVGHFKQGLRHGYCLDLGPYVHFSSQGDKPENLKRC